LTKKIQNINPFALVNLGTLGFNVTLDISSLSLIGFHQAFYFDLLGFPLIKICNVPWFFIPFL
jgi:hypothetical protein